MPASDLVLNPPEQVVPQARMDVDLPGYAWDLLPYRDRPLDLYRAHFWHAGFDHDKRTPFAAIYTSLGCKFACDFCMINIVNRVDNDEATNASHSRGMRFWSPEWVASEMRKLARMGVKTVRISDEMFFLNRKYYVPILDDCIQSEYGFNMWTYSRVDTVRADVAREVQEGRRQLAGARHRGRQSDGSTGSLEGVVPGGQHPRRLRDDSRLGHQRHQQLHFRLSRRQSRDDAADARSGARAQYRDGQHVSVPGSARQPALPYGRSKTGGSCPDSFEAFAFLSYESKPMRTKYLSAAEVLKFRDESWLTYFRNPAYLSLVERRFGATERRNVEQMSEIRLKRRLLGD